MAGKLNLVLILSILFTTIFANRNQDDSSQIRNFNPLLTETYGVESVKSDNESSKKDHSSPQIHDIQFWRDIVNGFPDSIETADHSYFAPAPHLGNIMDIRSGNLKLDEYLTHLENWNPYKPNMEKTSKSKGENIFDNDKVFSQQHYYNSQIEKDLSDLYRGETAKSYSENIRVTETNTKTEIGNNKMTPKNEEKNKNEFVGDIIAKFVYGSYKRPETIKETTPIPVVEESTEKLHITILYDDDDDSNDDEDSNEVGPSVPCGDVVEAILEDEKYRTNRHTRFDRVQRPLWVEKCLKEYKEKPQNIDGQQYWKGVWATLVSAAKLFNINYFLMS